MAARFQVWWKQQRLRSGTLRFVGVALLGVLVYANTFNHGFALDDTFTTYMNPKVAAGWAGVPALLTSHYAKYEGKEGFEYRPLAAITFATEVEFGLIDPNDLRSGTPFSHRVNVLLYGLLIFLFCQTITWVVPNRPWLPLLAGALFAVHPVHTEVVASLKNREEILAVLLGLVAFRWFWRWAKTEKPWQLVLALLAFGVGLTAKLAIIPMLGLVWLALMLFQPSAWRKHRLLLVGSSIALVLGYYFGISSMLGGLTRKVEIVENPLAYGAVSFGEYLGVTGYVAAEYLRLLIFPSRLIYYYGIDIIPIVSLANPKAFIGLLFYAILLFFGTRGVLKKRAWAFPVLGTAGTIGFYLIGQASYAGFVGERAMFLPSMPFSIGFAAFILWGLRLPETNSNSIKWLLPLALVGLGTWKTWERNPDWKSVETLINADLPKVKDSAYANVIAGNAYVSIATNANDSLRAASLYQKAITAFQQGLSVYRDMPQVLSELGRIYIEQFNNGQQGLFYVQEAIQRFVAPRGIDYYRLGKAHVLLNQNQPARDAFQQALALDDSLPEARNELVRVFALLGEADKAWQQNEIFLARNPNDDRGYVNKGNLYRLAGELDSAAVWYRKGLAISPVNPPLAAWLKAYEAGEVRQ